MKQIITLLFFTVAGSLVKGQTTIKGRVFSLQDSLPLAGATVSLEPSQRSYATNTKGEFHLMIDSLPATLSITYTGKQPQQITIRKIDDLGVLNAIYLQPVSNTLEEVIISTGYSDQKLENTTGAYSHLSSESLNRGVSANVLERLEGLSTALVFDRRQSGTSSISIRGLSTIYANKAPLIVLDNFPYDGDINNLNPNEIESITILKDAVAASIWGVRAGNGVIVIKTKKGSYGQKPHISFTANTTLVTQPDLRNLRMIPSADFIELERNLFNSGYYNAQENSAASPVLSPAVEIFIKQRDQLISHEEAVASLQNLATHNVKDDLAKYVYEKGLRQQYALTLRGGEERLAYSFLVGYDKDKGALSNTTDRLNIKAETNYKPFKNVEINGGIRYTKSGTTSGKPGHEALTATQTKSLLPYTRLADDQGNPLAIPKNYRSEFLAGAEQAGLLNWEYIPLLDYRHTDNRTNLSDILLNTQLSYRFLKNFRAEASYQYQHNSGERNNLQDAESYFARDIINRYSSVTNGELVRPVPLGGILDKTNTFLKVHAFRGQLNYALKNENHDMTALAGFDIREAHNGSSTFRRYGYNDENLTSSDVDFLNMYPLYYFPSLRSRIPNNTGFSDIVNRYTSIYANATYSHADRYHASFSARKDASNLFGVKENQRGVPLWSAGIGWTISNESFYNLKEIPYLKLRMSFGYNGNLDNSLTALTTILYSGSVTNLNNRSYASIFTPPNPYLSWEKNEIWNMGLDFSFFDRRITGTLDAYKKRGTNLIGDAPLDPTTGVANGSDQYVFRGNVAAMSGHGMDFEIHTINITGPFNWNTDLFASYTANKITAYTQNTDQGRSYVHSGFGIVPIIGKPLYGMYGYRWEGLDEMAGDPQGWFNNEISKDYNAIVNQTKVDELTYFGPALPTYFGSLINTFSYRNISLSFSLAYKLGHYYRESSIQYNNLYANWNGHSDYSKRWQQQGDELRTNIPSATYPANINRDTFYAGSSILVKKADNVRLQDIKLSYSLSKLKDKYNLQNFQVYLYVRNLGMIWSANKNGTDPDIISGILPGREVSLGLKIDF